MVARSSERSMDTALTNPVFDSSSNPSSNSYQYTKLVNDEQPATLLFQEKTINLPLLDSGDRYEEINSVTATVLQLYKSIEIRKAGIRKSLLGFKEALSLNPNTSIQDCFKTLRSRFSSTTQLELLLAGQEPIKLKVTDFSTAETSSAAQNEEDTKKALACLNACLNQCQKFTGEKELKVADIEVKLEDLQLMPLDKEGQTLYDGLVKIPSYIEELTMDINVLLREIYDARHILRPQ